MKQDKDENMGPTLVWSREPLYDTCIMPKNGIDILRFFVCPFNSGKTKTETNMNRAGRIEYPNQFLLSGFAITVPELTNKEDREAIRSGTFKFFLDEDIKFKDQEMLKSKGIEMPFCILIYSFFFREKLPLLITDVVNFSVNIDYPNGPVQLPSGNDCRVAVLMIGQQGNAI